MIADRVTARGAFKFPYTSGVVPEKSNTAVPWTTPKGCNCYRIVIAIVIVKVIIIDVPSEIFSSALGPTVG